MVRGGSDDGQVNVKSQFELDIGGRETCSYTSRSVGDVCVILRTIVSYFSVTSTNTHSFRSASEHTSSLIVGQETDKPEVVVKQ